MADTFINIIQFNPDDGSGPCTLLVDGGWKLTAGLRPDFNHAIASYIEFTSLSGIGINGSIDFYYTSDPTGEGASPDFSIADVLLLDAEVAEYGQPSGESDYIAFKYHMVFVDKRYAFVEPRGGRLNQGLLNPSTIIAPDPARTNTPTTVTLAGLIQKCLDAMGIDADYDDPQQLPPNDLKWFGTHAPTELAKLLAMGDMVFILQPDGSFSLQAIGDGDDPTISNPLPTVTLSGADGRGKTVVFSSFPTQLAATLTEADLSPSDWQFVAQNVNGAWVPIDSSGMYAPSAIAQVNAHSITDPHLLYEAFRFIRLNPNPYDPIISPILRKTWDAAGGTPSDPDPGSDTNNPNKLPPQIDIDFRAKVATYSPSGQSWSMPGSPVRVDIKNIHDGNVLELSHRLVKLNTSGGATTTTDLDGNCLAINLDTDIQIRFSIGMATWNAMQQKFLPAYYYSGFVTPAVGSGPPTQLNSADAQAAMNQPDTIVIAMAELVAMQFGLTGSIYNQTTLDNQCSALASRYLKDSTTPPRQLAGQGFFDFGQMNGTISEVEISQSPPMTKFKIDSWFRPAGSYLASEFNRLRRHVESHPHEAKTSGTRVARGEAGSSQPVQPMRSYESPSIGPPPYFTFAVTLSMTNGSNGTQTSAATYKYKILSMVDGSQIGTTEFAVEWPRSIGNVTVASKGIAYYDKTNTPHLLLAAEVPGTGACGS